MTNQEIGLQLYSVRKGLDMFRRMLRLMDTVKDAGEISNTKLNDSVDGGIQTIMEVLEQCGKVRSELRAEEFITVDEWGYHGQLDEEGFEITPMPKEITVTFEGKEITIPNPWRTSDRKNYGPYKKKIQVRRKYWIWVG